MYAVALGLDMLHQASGQWKLGLLLALITALCWASLPLVLKMTLTVIDPITLTWFRFLFAAVFMFFWLSAKKQLGIYKSIDKKRIWILSICSFTDGAGWSIYL